MASKISIDGVLTEISLGISDEEIETNDNDYSDTIDLRKVVEEINEQN